MTELKPCPFCGNTELRRANLHVDDRCNHGYAIFCDACGCILTNKWGVDEEIVNRLWNRRGEE